MDELLEWLSWLELYNETSALAASGGPDGPLPEDRRDAYRLLPDLIERCRESWLAIPESVRSIHYLTTNTA
jgi:hypothetical protein